jgi:hypothetical protein
MAMPGPDDQAARNDAEMPHAHLSTVLREPSLRAALLAAGLAITWAAISRWQRSRPSPLW